MIAVRKKASWKPELLLAGIGAMLGVFLSLTFNLPIKHQSLGDVAIGITVFFAIFVGMHKVPDGLGFVVARLAQLFMGVCAGVLIMAAFFHH